MSSVFGENKRVRILWEFQFQTDLVMANQLDTVVVDKHQKTAMLIDVAIQSEQHQEEGTREA